MTGIRSFYVCTALFALGTFSAQFSPFVIPAWPAFAAAVACLVLCRRRTGLRPWACFAVGLLWALGRAGLVLDTKWPPVLEGRDVTLRGTVAGLPERNERYLKFDLNVEEARFKGEPVVFQARVRLRWYDPPPTVRRALQAATTWRVEARLKQPHGFYNPGGFDYEAYLFRERVRANGYVRESPVNERIGAAHAYPLLAARQALRQRLEASLAGARHPGLIKALALGDRSGISADAWDTLRATGTNHLIAISGLHIGFVAAIGALLGAAAGRIAAGALPSVSAPRVGAAAALAVALAYAALSGFAVPAQRAFVMAAVFLLGILCRRHAWTLRGLCVALLAVLILDPAAVHDPGFWLSFGAVALIIGWLSRRPDPAGRTDTGAATGAGTSRYARLLGGRMLAAVKLQWLLSLALLPLVTAFFGVASLVAGPANMLAVPAVVFCLVPLCLAAATVAALGLPSAAALCLNLADAVMHRLWGVLSWLGELHYARLEAHLELWQAAALFAGALWLILARPGLRPWGLVCLAALLAPGPSAPARGEYSVTVLDVGQGLSAVVRTARHVLVYDTGPRYPGGFSLAKAALIPYLRQQGIGGIDLLMVSHGDNDHRGGFEDLVSRYPPARVLSSIDLPGSRFCVQGQHWSWDGVMFEVLHPTGPRPPAHNNASCVLRISGPHGAVLLTGDIETRVEEALIRRWGERLSSEVLLVPHQGSETSSSPAFIERVAPRWAVVSAGYRNRYRHPRPAVIERYHRRGIRVRNTAWSGALAVKVRDTGISVTGWREAAPRYWLDADDPAPGRDAI